MSSWSPVNGPKLHVSIVSSYSKNFKSILVHTKKRKNSHLAGLEPATFRLTAERANRLRHKCQPGGDCSFY